MTIKERMGKLKDAEEQWIENYRKSLDEWNERNKVHAHERIAERWQPFVFLC